MQLLSRSWDVCSYALVFWPVLEQALDSTRFMLEGLGFHKKYGENTVCQKSCYEILNQLSLIVDFRHCVKNITP